MLDTSLHWLALLLLLSFLIYHLIIHPAFLSPLAKIPPAHPTASISSAWILWQRFKIRGTGSVHEAHERLGPIVRLAPNEISLNCVDGGLRTIYSGGYEKGSWYGIFENYGRPNMFSSLASGPHSARKRNLANIYAKSTLLGSATMHAITHTLVHGRLLPRLNETQGEVVEAYELFSSYAMDGVTAYLFGLARSTKFLSTPETSKQWLVNFKSRQFYSFWDQELPLFTATLRKLGLIRLAIPKWVTDANEPVDELVLEMSDASEADFQKYSLSELGDVPVVYRQLRNAVVGDATKEIELLPEQRLEIASELLDHVGAGSDTSGTTLTYLAWELSKPHNIDTLTALRDELRVSCAAGPTGDAEELTARQLDGLPVLHAVIMETLRLHAAIPGEQPRITPPNASLGPPGCTVSGIPAGVKVNSQAHSLHRNPDVFPEPERWLPQRWLTDDGKIDGGGEKGRWFWAFGSGGRMCIGSNLAMIEMKAVVAAVWSNYSTSIVDDAGMRHNGGYIAEPVGSPEGNYLLLKFTALAKAA